MNILVISHFSPPLNKVPSQRIFQLCKQWQKNGAKVTLLTTKKYKIDGENGYDVNLNEAFSEIIELDYSPALKKILPKKIIGYENNNSEHSQKSIESRKNIGDKSFIHSLRKIILANVLAMFDFCNLRVIGNKRKVHDVFTRVRPDIIYSSYSPQWSHRIAKYGKQKYTNIPWYAEFRDMWTYNHSKNITGISKHVSLFQEKNTVKDADVLVTVTRDWSKELAEIHGKKAMCIYNGFDGREVRKISYERENKQDIYRIVFAGTLYENYDFGEIFRALKTIDNQSNNTTRVVLDIYGRGTETLKNYVDELGLSSVVFVHGLVDRNTCLEAMASADSLLLLQFSNSNAAGHIPAKVFDYISLGKPIVFRKYQSSSELADIVNRCVSWAEILIETDYVHLFSAISKGNFDDFQGTLNQTNIDEFDRVNSASYLMAEFNRVISS